MMEDRADTAVGRVVTVVRQVLQSPEGSRPEGFTSDEVARAVAKASASDEVAEGAEAEPSSSLKHTVSTVLSTLESLGMVERIVRGRWQATFEDDTRQWRDRVVMSFRRLGTSMALPGRPDVEAQRARAAQAAAERALEELRPLSGKKLFLDSGRQVACFAKLIGDGLANRAPSRRADHTDAIVFTSNLLAFLELAPFTTTGELPSLHMIGGHYVAGAGANVPRDAERAWEVLAEGLPPVVITSLAALTEHGMWSHFAEQAKWKRMILEKAVSLYLVVDSSKLSEGRYAGQLLMGDEQDKPKWDELWKKWEKQTDFHVVVGHDREAKLPQSCKAAAKWLKGKLGDRFITEPDYSDWP